MNHFELIFICGVKFSLKGVSADGCQMAPVPFVGPLLFHYKTPLFKLKCFGEKMLKQVQIRIGSFVSVGSK